MHITVQDKKCIRLTDKEISAIKTSFEKIFGESEVILFGSRTDSSQKGGNIDLYLIPANRENLRKKRIDFAILLELLLGEQKIDIVIANEPKRLIDWEALKSGVSL